MNKSKWVLVDLSYLSHKARFWSENLSEKDIPTSILYNVLNQILILSTDNKVRSNRFLIFGDSQKSYRKESYPLYKSKRGKYRSEEEKKQIKIMHKQISILGNHIFPVIGFSCYRQTGLESDDLIANVAKQLTFKKQDGVIITSDTDLYQCISKYIAWYSPGKKYLRQDHLWNEKGVSAKQWGIMKSLAGCPTDNVPGVRGVGEVTAIKYILNDRNVSEKIRNAIDIATKNKEVDLWRELTELPHKKTKPIKIKSPEYDIQAFRSICKEYRLTPFLQKLRFQEWERFFRKKG